MLYYHSECVCVHGSCHHRVFAKSENKIRSVYSWYETWPLIATPSCHRLVAQHHSSPPQGRRLTLEITAGLSGVLGLLAEPMLSTYHWISPRGLSEFVTTASAFLQCFFTDLAFSISINQSNFYSANIPGEARLSGATAKSVFNSKIEETVP